jgi:sugar transferase EpsL
MYPLLKRLSDVLVAGAMLVILWPLLLVIALTIRIAGPGPALFRQERGGRDGRPFAMLKFRTMRLDVDPFGPSPKSGGDPRLTRIGKLLREYSLDELPQLINILRGDMTLVGPRPLYMSQIAEWDTRQRKRLLVKPGLTGLAQISGRGELTVEEKLELDVRYVEQACLKLDAHILLSTFTRVLARQEIYEKRYSRTEDTRRQSGSNTSSNSKGRE